MYIMTKKRRKGKKQRGTKKLFKFIKNRRQRMKKRGRKFRRTFRKRRKQLNLRFRSLRRGGNTLHKRALAAIAKATTANNAAVKKNLLPTKQ